MLTQSNTWIFIKALFIIVKTWKQTRCPSVGKWINKMVCPDSGILYSTENKVAIKPHQDTEKA